MKLARALALFLAFGFAIHAASAQSRIVLGGSKAVIMVVDSVYLFPGIGSKIVAAAKGDQGLGVFISAIDPGFAEKPSFAASAGPEVYASFKPDLVIMKRQNEQSLGQPLTSLGIPQLYLDLETPKDYFADILALGKVFGENDRAKAVVGYYADKADEVAKKITTLAPSARPKVLVVQAASPSEGVWEVPPASWMQTLLAGLAGGNAVWTRANPGSGWGKVNPEQIVAWNPDVVFVISYKGDPSRAAAIFRGDPRMGSVAAVKSDAVFGFAKDFYSWDQPDTRWILGLQWMAAKIHPELFPAYSAIESAREFYKFCYGVSDAGFEKLLAPKLTGDLGGGAGN